ncbi:site-specific integrase [Lactobacillus sp. ESL0681]|uniref:tyrosine-type recombinase/integrase n=1 Tax=Lactobacillus sp. ESL0681 TaxID=2983211 RepID=UPI0023F9A66F|nr:site-specific integrase [Lactobacillus sp. ESL0681]WEV40309.1 site-specific integrase [Lactobacillus sp. ESL0681]
MSIYKRGKKWTVQISWYVLDPDSKSGKKKKYKTKGGFFTKAEAKKWEIEQISAKNSNQITNENPVFVDFFWDWATTYRLPGTTDATKRRYTSQTNILRKYFGLTKINNISRNDYQKFINDYGESHSKITVKKLHGVIKACISDAHDEGIVPQNFTNRINVVWNDKKTHHIEYLSIAEIQALIKVTKDSLNHKFTTPYMILTATYTGMRLGEIMALTWSDIDEKKQTININKSYDYISQKIKAPKNSSSKRTIYISKSLIKILNDLKQNDHKFVFAESNNKLPSNNSVNHALRVRMKKANINKKGFHFHSLRHCHVAYLVAHHVDWYEISKRLGHSNIGITMDTYSYMIDEMKAAQQKILAQALDSMDEPQKLHLA